MDDVEVGEVVVVDADVDAVDADVDVVVLVLPVLWVYPALSKVELPSDRLWWRRRLTEGGSTKMICVAVLLRHVLTPCLTSTTISFSCCLPTSRFCRNLDLYRSRCG